MVSTKAQQILERVLKHLKSTNVTSSKLDNSVESSNTVNKNYTDNLFPNSPDSGPEPNLPITGPDQGMLSTRNR